ncbi:MAG: tRNA lysidine(34) synthetase TilS [Candidatus Shikimatogenerans sp. JK-2022]|nr:tRNA lysidine(34) synthetase TilS [Candidatus Shikimatogenerans bostrichidophilus]
MKFFFFFKKFNTLKYSKKKKISIQMAARILKYKFFFKIKKKYNFNYILLAHHLDDKIETFFINLLRKTGLYGLKSMNIFSYKNNIIRPLLKFYKTDIIKYAINNNIKWLNDKSNYKNYYLRNKIRNIILPIIYKKIINSKLNIVNTIKNLNLEYKILNNIIKKFKNKILKKKKKKILININKLLKFKYYNYFLYKIFKKYYFNDFKIFKKLPFLNNNKKIYSKKNKYILIKKKKYILFLKKKNINNDRS